MKKITKELQIIPTYSIKPEFEKQELEEKEKILQFFKMQPEAGMMSGHFYDNGKETISEVKMYTYKDFMWDDAVIFCFEKYDIKLDPEFIKIAAV